MFGHQIWWIYDVDGDAAADDDDYDYDDVDDDDLWLIFWSN